MIIIVINIIKQFLNIFYFPHINLQEGINVLTAALEEGIQCYGIDHCEVKEI